MNTKELSFRHIALRALFTLEFAGLAALAACGGGERSATATATPLPELNHCATLEENGTLSGILEQLGYGGTGPMEITYTDIYGNGLYPSSRHNSLAELIANPEIARPGTKACIESPDLR